MKAISKYIQINLVAAIIIAATLISLIIFLSPKEKKVSTNLNSTNNLISNQYDEATHTFKDINIVNKLQAKSEDIQGDYFVLKLIKFLIISIILITITGPFANLLHWSYTKINFGESTTLNPPMLIAILIITFLIEFIVYQSIFVSLIK